MNTHRLGAGQFVEFIFIHEWNEIWNDGDDMICRNTKLHENMIDMVVAVVTKSKEKTSKLTDLLHPYFSVAPWFEKKEGESLTKEKGDNVTMKCSAQGFPLMVEWKAMFSNNETVLPCIGKVDMNLSHPIP